MMPDFRLFFFCQFSFRSRPVKPFKIGSVNHCWTLGTLMMTYITFFSKMAEGMRNNLFILLPFFPKLVIVHHFLLDEE